MKTNFISLTNSGFKNYFDHRFVHYIQFGILFLIGFYFTELHFIKIFSILFFLFYSSLFFILYKYKIGHIYSLNFFYQILLFFCILPNQFFNPLSVFISLSLYFLILFKFNLFYNFPFPISIFLYFTNFIFYSLFSKVPFLNFANLILNSIPTEINLKLIPISFSKISDFSLNGNHFSSLDKSGVLVFIFVFVLVLKNKDFFYEILSLIFFAILLILFYSEFYLSQILFSIGIWNLFHFSLGKNSSILKIFTFTSTIFILITILLFRNYYFSLIEILGIYYTIYSFQFLLVKKFHFQKNLFLKFENRL